MKGILYLVLMVFLSSMVNAQITFQKKIGGAAWDVGRVALPVSGGNYVIAGSAQSFGAGGTDFYLIKADSNGNVIWTKTYGGNGYDIPGSLQQTSDGGFILIGLTHGFGASVTDIYLVKTDQNGNLSWSKTYSGAYEDAGYAVMQTTDGGYILTGYSDLGSVNDDVLLIKTNSTGDTLWTKTFGGPDYDIGSSIEQTSDGGYIIAGTTNSFGAGGNDYDMYLVKTDASGTILWTKIYGGSGGDMATSVHQIASGDYIITGHTNSFNSGNDDVYLVKTDSSGNLIWTKTYGGASTENGNAFQQTSDGGYIIAGSSVVGSGHDFYVVKTDVNGDTLWTKSYGGASDEAATSVAQTNDGGYLLTGGKFAGSVNSLYLIKTDSLGNSGCDQGSILTVVNSPVTQETTVATIDTLNNITVSTPATQSGSGGTVTTYCFHVGLNEMVPDNSFLIFPNPCYGNFNISFETNIAERKIEISDLSGRIVFISDVINETIAPINLNIAGGIYCVKLVDKKSTYCRKLIVENH